MGPEGYRRSPRPVSLSSPTEKFFGGFLIQERNPAVDSVGEARACGLKMVVFKRKGAMSVDSARVA